MQNCHGFKFVIPCEKELLKSTLCNHVKFTVLIIFCHALKKIT